MSTNIVLILIFLIVSINSIQIPFIQDVIFVPLSQSNNITYTNRTCNQCLCMSSTSNLILNCLPTNTCLFFSNFPVRYQIQQVTQARLYFLRGIYPNASQCCMPNTTYLLNKLKNATPTSVPVNGPRDIAFDNHGYLVTVSYSDGAIVRIDSTHMTVINYTRYSFSSPMAIRYYNENYYVGFSDHILVIDSNNLTIRNNITSSYINGTRDIMFLNNGNRLVATSLANNYLLFFNRSSNASTNYYLDYKQLVTYTSPHGLFYVNDTYFYVTAWDSNTIYSYSAIQGNTRWKENLFIDALYMTTPFSAAHVTIDEDSRIWFSLGSNGLKIYDKQGLFLDNFSLSNLYIFDTMITDNYVIYISDFNNNKVIRIDPDVFD